MEMSNFKTYAELRMPNQWIVVFVFIKVAAPHSWHKSGDLI